MIEDFTLTIFQAWQPLYAERRIATFPVSQEKRPLVDHYGKIGLRASAQLAQRFATAENFAFLAGARNRISVVDVDTTDELIWHGAEKQFGSTPLWVRTGSGHLQMLYRHGGERRHIRPRGELPIDILGSGQILAAPSVRGQGYELIRGTLADLDRLPPIQRLEFFLGVGKGVNFSSAPRDLVQPGRRNATLLDYLRQEAKHCDTLSGLVDVAETFAEAHFEQGSQPFTSNEIERVAKSVWTWTQEKIAAGEYFVATGRNLQISFDVQDRLMQSGADAWFLYCHLRRCRYRDRTFAVPNDMRCDLPGGAWSVVRFRNARSALVASGVLVERQAASSYHGAARYAWQRAAAPTAS